MRSAQNERGIALALAIMALVVIGALVAGAFFVGMQEQQVGRNTIRLQQASAAAEEGAQLTLANWDAGVYNQLPVGDSTTFGGTLAGNAGWYRGAVVRLNTELFLIRAEGFGRDSATRQHVGLLVRLRPLEVLINAALKTQGATKIGGSSFIDGADRVPDGWTGCPALDPSQPGIRITDPALITTSGCNDLDCVSGDPKVAADTTINDSTLTTFGDATWEDLVAMANKTIGVGPYNSIAPSLSSGLCNTADVQNWGDPLNPAGPCHDYFPIIYAPNGTKLTGGYGQGILIVEGDLSVQGGFQFFGPVIVKGILNTQGTGGHFNGGVIAANVNLDQNTVLGNAIVSYSSCAVLRALNASAEGAPLQERSYVTLY